MELSDTVEEKNLRNVKKYESRSSLFRWDTDKQSIDTRDFRIAGRAPTMMNRRASVPIVILASSTPR